MEYTKDDVSKIIFEGKFSKGKKNGFGNLICHNSEDEQVLNIKAFFIDDKLVHKFGDDVSLEDM